jgi:hypothetical protein
MITHTTVQAMGQARLPTCTTKPGAIRWSAQLAAPGGSGPGQCAWAREPHGQRPRPADREG